MTKTRCFLVHILEDPFDPLLAFSPGLTNHLTTFAHLPHSTAQTGRTRQIQTEQGWERVGQASGFLKTACGSLTKWMSQYSNQHSLPCGYKWVSHLVPSHWILSVPKGQGRSPNLLPHLKLVDTMGARATRPINKCRCTAK